MQDVAVYYASQTTPDKVLTKLLEKVLSQNQRATVWLESEERLAALDGVLWTYSTLAFLPHGSARDGNADRQPIWLTTTEENPNGSQVLVCMDGTVPQGGPKSVSAYERCLLILDEGAPAGEAVERFVAACRAQGISVNSWKQTPQGQWAAA